MLISEVLNHLHHQLGGFPSAAGDHLWTLDVSSDSWMIQVSEDTQWLRIQVPIATASQAKPFLRDLMEFNFELTGLVRYALSNQVLWCTFHHSLATLQETDLAVGVKCLLDLKRQGLSGCFEAHVDQQVRLIIAASKGQGLTLEATLKNLERLYREGIIGDLNDPGDTIQQTLSRWRERLSRLWPEVEAAATVRPEI
ncbi:hypothetical protein [Lyngbya confervoides]|uniref:YbjN domain-containing protein n=1 Tax=Lyngbya confervoides BDU141951 TaxID=1574623 RepID=A0ABD4T0J2_9CYAN|nr:hypothetical protein [Lyngbya confervoides]MCM1982179.1 hypothetical protein [Lyngbya confervoides BDU141951]